eukprot:CAMPEP_0181515644 /NCGR_PEP_ID=MMETSP1110-20121109/63687_1 /TAXON_ID=174948 /ORGANISM="Symbiodinium sp., Strain CCMP421" /LENGTH=62 /DNA_ID=CAMNT_0023645681 /DNA_START=35 /DNA_END=220 /DNA_ORIENTATION=+
MEVLLVGILGLGQISGLFIVIAPDRPVQQHTPSDEVVALELHRGTIYLHRQEAIAGATPGMK